MSPSRLVTLTGLALLAFAGNSLLCRVALKETTIDAASFTTIRLISGALILWIICAADRGTSNSSGRGDWHSAMALFAYAACFSFAYIDLSAATGALLLFGAVQITMIAYSLYQGERLSTAQVIGFALAIGGLIGLLSPGFTAPPLQAAALMLAAGVAWGIYSLKGKQASNPTQTTADNFLKTVPMTVVLSLITLSQFSIDMAGALYAIASGALASGAGYAIWYRVLPSLKASQAATLQLSVPVIAAFGGVLLLSEALTSRLIIASIAILGGIAIFIYKPRSNQS